VSFLKHYRDFVEQTEAHPNYHIFSALVALASIVGRRVWIDQGIFSVVPNLYVVLVGPSGNRKTSAMTPAKHLIRELGLPYSAECVTKEKLVLDVFAQERAIKDIEAWPQDWKDRYGIYSPMTCMVTELSEFLGAGGLGMINFLVTIYDQDFYDIRTKNKGDVAIRGPYLNVLACTTPDWITIYLRQDVISGGFSRRAIFVLETTKGNKIAFPEITPVMVQAWKDMVAYSRILQGVKGPFTWDTGTKNYYEKWYHHLTIPANPMLAGYYESKHIQLLKIAMLLSLSESPERVLRIEHLETGLELLGLAEVNMARVFAGMGRNELNPISNKVLEAVRVQPDLEMKVNGLTQHIKGLPEKQLRAMFFHDATSIEMDQIIRHLEESGRIERLMFSSGDQQAQRLFIRAVE
jgi:hypothetical protein